MSGPLPTAPANQVLMESRHTGRFRRHERTSSLPGAGSVARLSRGRCPFADGVVTSAHGKNLPDFAPPRGAARARHTGQFIAVSSPARSVGVCPFPRCKHSRGAQVRAPQWAHSAEPKDTQPPLPLIPVRKWGGSRPYDMDTFLSQIRAIVRLYNLFFSSGRGSQPTPEIPEN